ncbi:MAG TPA: cupin domain-containing protein [Acidimicrobiia bacterium]|jgi:uncharacterized RmlC-like cupin family protein|nr:cupin domain-containing protein [Acidimicrobiia bacterium]
MTAIRVIKAGERLVSEADATSGMVREQAVSDDRVWAGYVKAAPQRPSGWHHHGEYDTYIYVLSGELSFDFGPQGSESVAAGPGDFVHVPKGLIHREVNSAAEEGAVVLFRMGSGPPVINVDGPEGD